MPIPKHISASAGLAAASRFAGEIAPASLPRLKPDLAADHGPLQVDLRLEHDRAGRWLKGAVRGKLGLECRRCLKLFAWPLDAPVELRLVNSEAEEREALETADPYLVPEDDRLPLQEIVEDEVLLALPMMPRCQECTRAVAEDSAAAPAEEEPSPQAANPFAQLLKNDRTGAVGAPRK